MDEREEALLELASRVLEWSDRCNCRCHWCMEMMGHLNEYKKKWRQLHAEDLDES